MSSPRSGIDLVIFDCDGVLVDTERIVVQVEAQLFAERGWDIPVDRIIDEFVGLSDAAMRNRIVELTGEELGDEWDRTYADRVQQALTEHVEPVPGVVDAIDAIEASGRGTCVASSGTHDKMSLTLGSTGLLSRFEGRIYSSTDETVERGKPFPDLFLHAAAVQGVPPGRCAVVEDSPHGIEAALAAGMRAFGFSGSVTPRERLARPGVVVVDRMAELPAAIDAAG